MGEAVLTAAITGGLTLLGTIITVMATSSKTREKIVIEQAKTGERIDTLTKSVERHNNFAQRMPVVEEQIKVINHRIDDLERKVDD